MSHFLKKIENSNGFQLLIDTSIFEKDIILKAAYNFLDIWYFFFKFDQDKNIVLECRAKDGVNFSSETIIGEYSDELLAVYLRDKLEKDNKIIRETIVTKAINGPLDMQNFVSLDTDAQEKSEIDFDKDIDQILKELEENPNVSLDENEIQNILDEIDSDASAQRPSIIPNTQSIENIKNMFHKK